MVPKHHQTEDEILVSRKSWVPLAPLRGTERPWYPAGTQYSSSVKDTTASKIIMIMQQDCMERTDKFLFQIPRGNCLFAQNEMRRFLIIFFFLGPFYSSHPLRSPSDTSVQGNFSTVTIISLQISDPLHERTIATSSFNLILHPNPLPAERPVPPISQGWSMVPQLPSFSLKGVWLCSKYC